MTTSELPGYEYAKSNGYSLSSYGGDRNSADYVKDDIILSITASGSATLWVMVGLVELTIGPFSFPHPNIEKFYSAIKRIYELATS